MTCMAGEMFPVLFRGKRFPVLAGRTVGWPVGRLSEPTMKASKSTTTMPAPIVPMAATELKETKPATGEVPASVTRTGEAKAWAALGLAGFPATRVDGAAVEARSFTTRKD